VAMLVAARRERASGDRRRPRPRGVAFFVRPVAIALPAGSSSAPSRSSPRAPRRGASSRSSTIVSWS
jgi:hypothetical protein